MVQIRPHIYQVLMAAHFGADEFHLGFFPFPGQPLVDVPHLFSMDLDFADGHLGPVPCIHVLEQVHQPVFRITVKEFIHMEPAVLAGLELQLAHQPGSLFRHRVGDPHRGVFPFGYRHPAVYIAALLGLGQGFPAGSLEISQIRQPIPFVGFHLGGTFLAYGQFHRLQFLGFQRIQFQMVHFHPPEGGTRKFIELFFGHHSPPPFYMEPFSSRLIRLFISTAYSKGSALETGSTKPRTSMARASSSLRPRLIR